MNDETLDDMHVSMSASLANRIRIFLCSIISLTVIRSLFPVNNN